MPRKFSKNYYKLNNHPRKYQSYKGAVGATLRQNEAELKISKENDHQTASTDQAGDISDFPCLFCEWDVGVNVHLTFYICLILAECHNNCSF